MSKKRNKVKFRSFKDLKDIAKRKFKKSLKKYPIDFSSDIVQDMAFLADTRSHIDGGDIQYAGFVIHVGETESLNSLVSQIDKINNLSDMFLMRALSQSESKVDNHVVELIITKGDSEGTRYSIAGGTVIFIHILEDLCDVEIVSSSKYTKEPKKKSLKKELVQIKELPTSILESLFDPGNPFPVLHLIKGVTWSFSDSYPLEFAFLSRQNIEPFKEFEPITIGYNQIELSSILKRSASGPAYDRVEITVTVNNLASGSCIKHIETFYMNKIVVISFSEDKLFKSVEYQLADGVLENVEILIESDTQELVQSTILSEVKEVNSKVRESILESHLSRIEKLRETLKEMELTKFSAFQDITPRIYNRAVKKVEENGCEDKSLRWESSIQSLVGIYDTRYNLVEELDELNKNSASVRNLGINFREEVGESYHDSSLTVEHCYFGDMETLPPGSFMVVTISNGDTILNTIDWKDLNNYISAKNSLLELEKEVVNGVKEATAILEVASNVEKTPFDWNSFLKYPEGYTPYEVDLQFLKSHQATARLGLFPAFRSIQDGSKECIFLMKGQSSRSIVIAIPELPRYQKDLPLYIQDMWNELVGRRSSNPFIDRDFNGFKLNGGELSNSFLIITQVNHTTMLFQVSRERAMIELLTALEESYKPNESADSTLTREYEDRVTKKYIISEVFSRVSNKLESRGKDWFEFFKIAVPEVFQKVVPNCTLEGYRNYIVNMYPFMYATNTLSDFTPEWRKISKEFAGHDITITEAVRSKWEDNPHNFKGNDKEYLESHIEISYLEKNGDTEKKSVVIPAGHVGIFYEIAGTLYLVADRYDSL